MERVISLQMQIPLTNVKVSYKRVASTLFTELLQCLQHLKNNQPQIISILGQQIFLPFRSNQDGVNVPLSFTKLWAEFFTLGPNFPLLRAFTVGNLYCWTLNNQGLNLVETQCGFFFDKYGRVL